MTREYPERIEIKTLDSVSQTFPRIKSKNDTVALKIKENRQSVAKQFFKISFDENTFYGLKDTFIILNKTD